MRFTSAFIPTLLSASMVLADYYFHPYAGYKVQTQADENWFVYVSVDVVMPELGWNCNWYTEELGYIAAAIGHPLVCGSSIEAGVRLTCRSDGTKNYETYWKLFPYPLVTVTAFEINEGDEIHLEVTVELGHFFVIFRNLSTGESSPRLLVADASSIGPCLETAMWVLRANTIPWTSPGILLWPTPAFDVIDFNVEAKDFYGREYKVPEGEDAPGRLIMGDAIRPVIVIPFRTGDNSFTLE